MVTPQAGDRALDGDAGRRARFRKVFDEEFDYVWASLRRLGVHPRDLEDVAQDLFVHVYRKLDEHDRTRPIRPWLFAFAARCASDWRRLARHRFELLGVERDAPSATPGADAALETQQDAELVYQALESVGEERRAAFILHEFDGCSMKEITDLFGIPLATGYSRLRVARDEFTSAVRRLRLSRGGQ